MILETDVDDDTQQNESESDAVTVEVEQPKTVISILKPTTSESLLP